MYYVQVGPGSLTINNKFKIEPESLQYLENAPTSKIASLAGWDSPVYDILSLYNQ